MEKLVCQDSQVGRHKTSETSESLCKGVSCKNIIWHSMKAFHFYNSSALGLTQKNVFNIGQLAFAFDTTGNNLFFTGSQSHFCVKLNSLMMTKIFEDCLIINKADTQLTQYLS